MEIWDSVVIGAGQAGLSASYHLTRRGIRHVVLDAEQSPGGAWQHRWDALTLRDVHRIAELPGADPLPDTGRSGERPANQAVPDYFAAYERDHHLPVIRPAKVDRVVPADPPTAADGRVGTSRSGLLVVHATSSATSGAGPGPGSSDATLSWTTRTIVNATGTWTQPHWPYYPGRETFLGEQLHTHDYPGPEHFLGKRVLVVGGGASAVQFLGALAPITDVVWVTRRPPVWRDAPFDPEVGSAVVSLVEDRVRRGLPPASVVSVTGLILRPQEAEARRLGVYDRRLPMFSSIEPDGVRWADPRESGTAFERVDVILWATGFRPAVAHLAPLHLRSEAGGIQLDHAGTTAVVDPRVQLVGYGPSASTIGANRAGRFAARGVATWLAAARPDEPGTPSTAAQLDRG